MRRGRARQRLGQAEIGDVLRALPLGRVDAAVDLDGLHGGRGQRGEDGEGQRCAHGEVSEHAVRVRVGRHRRSDRSLRKCPHPCGSAAGQSRSDAAQASRVRARLPTGISHGNQLSRLRHRSGLVGRCACRRPAWHRHATASARLRLDPRPATGRLTASAAAAPTACASRG